MKLSYLLRRFVFLIFVIWSAATLLFFIPRLSKVNPIRQHFVEIAQRSGYLPSDLNNIVANFEIKFGLDKPLPQQYVDYMGSVLRGDLGISLMSYPKTVNQLIGEALPWTIGLLTITTILTFLLGTAVGALAGWPKSPHWVKGMVTPLIVLAAIPPQVLGLLLIYFVAFRLKLLPMAGAFSIGAQPQFSLTFILDIAKHALLPSVTLLLAYIGFWALGMRGMGVTVQGEDYVLFAEHKGLKDNRIFYSYYVRNAILPQVTSLALAFGGIISAGVLVEAVFGFPGIGSTLTAAIAANDYFVIYGIGFITIFAVGISMLVVDLIYPLLDPRIRYGK